MNNPTNLQALQTVPLSSLFKPEQVSKFSFDDQTKATYVQMLANLWKQIHTHPQESPEYQTAYKKLVEMTHVIRHNIKKIRDQHVAAQANQGQAEQRQQALASNNKVQPLEQISQKVLQHVQSQNFVPPPSIAQQGPEQVQNWVREAKQKYVHYLQRMETAQKGLAELTRTAENRQKEGKTFSPEEVQRFSMRKNQLIRAAAEAKEHLTKFKQQQDAIKASAAGNSTSNVPRNPGTQPPNVEQPQNAGGPQPSLDLSKLDGQGQIHSVSSTVDAARSQPNGGNRSTISPQNGGQPGQPGMNQIPNSHNLANSAHQSTSHPNTATNNTAAAAVQQQPASQQQPQTQPQPSHSSQQPIPNPQSASSQGPHPLTHSAAMAQAARSHPSQPNHPQSNSQPSTHAHPQIGGGNRDNVGSREPQNSNSIKMPLPAGDARFAEPTPIPMGPARPTLTGGPSTGATGPLGQPAIQKHPGYVLEGDGERVLSKKKLEELVRQVTGGNSAEGEEGETLSAEVEEVYILRPIPPSPFPFRAPSSSFPCLIHISFYSHFPPFPLPDAPPSRRRFRRPSHRRRVPARQTATVVHAGAARHPAYSRTQLQHPRAGLRVR